MREKINEKEKDVQEMWRLTAFVLLGMCVSLAVLLLIVIVNSF